MKEKVGLTDAIVRLVDKYPAKAVEVLKEDPDSPVARGIAKALIKGHLLEVAQQQAEKKPEA